MRKPKGVVDFTQKLSKIFSIQRQIGEIWGNGTELEIELANLLSPVVI
jgi:hypothetical protein